MQKLTYKILAIFTVVMLLTAVFAIPSYAIPNAPPPAYFPAPTPGEVLVGNYNLQNSASINSYISNVIWRQDIDNFGFDLPVWWFNTPNRSTPVRVTSYGGILNFAQPTTGTSWVYRMPSSGWSLSSAGTRLNMNISGWGGTTSSPCMIYRIIDLSQYSSGSAIVPPHNRQYIFRFNSATSGAGSSLLASIRFAFFDSQGLLVSEQEFSPFGFNTDDIVMGFVTNTPPRYFVSVWYFGSLNSNLGWNFPAPSWISYSYDLTPREIAQEETNTILNSISNAMAGVVSAVEAASNAVSEVIINSWNISTTAITNAVNMSTTAITSAVNNSTTAISNAVKDGIDNMLYFNAEDEPLDTKDEKRDGVIETLKDWTQQLSDFAESITESGQESKVAISQGFSVFEAFMKPSPLIFVGLLAFAAVFIVVRKIVGR